MNEEFARKDIVHETYSTEKNAPGGNVQVHQVVYDPGLQVSLDMVDDNLTSNVNQLDIRQVFLGNRLVSLSVMDNASLKVLHGLLWIHVFVIGRRQLDRHDVVKNQGLILAHRLGGENVGLYARV